MNNLYTIIMTYEEGRYVAQVTASNPKQAIDAWVKQLDFEKMGIRGLSETSKEEFFKEMCEYSKDEDEEPNPFQDIQSSWSDGVFLADKLMLIDIVLTKESH